MTIKLNWIVLEEDPIQDNYVAIMVANEKRILKVFEKKYSVFTSEQDAIKRAREVGTHYGVKNIKMFYMDGHHEMIYKSSF